MLPASAHVLLNIAVRTMAVYALLLAGVRLRQARSRADDAFRPDLLLRKGIQKKQ
jgi:hypothetical protein